MKRILLAGLVAVASVNAYALGAGDMAFTSFNADEDGWSMVTFADIAANTTLYFSDNEWNGLAIGAGGAFNSGESFHKWTSGASVISAGTVVRFLATDRTTLSSSFGTLTRESVSGSTNYGTANSNETIYAYQGGGAATPTRFIAAVTNGSFTADGSLTGTGLVESSSAIRLNTNAPAATPDYAEYNGPRNGQTTFAGFRSLVNDPAHWTVDTTNGTYTNSVPNVTAFTISPVPEAETWTMLLAGLGLIGSIARRRRT